MLNAEISLCNDRIAEEDGQRQERAASELLARFVLEVQQDVRRHDALGLDRNVQVVAPDDGEVGGASAEVADENYFFRACWQGFLIGKRGGYRLVLEPDLLESGLARGIFEPALRQALEAGRPALLHLALDPRWTTPDGSPTDYRRSPVADEAVEAEEALVAEVEAVEALVAEVEAIEALEAAVEAVEALGIRSRGRRGSRGGYGSLGNGRSDPGGRSGRDRPA